MLQSIIAERDQAVAGSTERKPAVRGALASLSLSMLLSALGTSIANVGLPTLAQAFNASFQEVQWIVLAYLLAITTLIVSVGRLGDMTGRRRLLLAGIFLFTVASVLCGIASTLWLLIAARAAQGLGAAIMMASPWRLSVRRFRRKRPLAPWDYSEQCPRLALRSVPHSAAF